MIDKSYLQTRIAKAIVGIMFLFYVISCGSSENTTSPSSKVIDLDTIKALTLNGVSEDSITLDWELLKTKEGIVDPTITYTVYVETPDETGVFTNIPSTERVYTLLFPVDLGEGRRSTVLPQDDAAGRVSGIKVGGLNNDTPYRIVVEARDASGNTGRSELLAYTASALADSDISGVETFTTIDSGEVTVTWEPKEGAQFYLIQASEDENQFGGSISVDKFLAVVCPLDSLLCESKTQFAEPLGNNKLGYFLQVNKKGKYKLAIIPFNFQDLKGFRVVDEEGRVKTFTEEVLAQVEDEDSVLSQRLKDSSHAQEVQIKVSIARAPTGLELESTGNTLSAKWEHGIGAEYYYAILTGREVVVTNIINRYEASGEFAGGGYTGFEKLIPETPYTVTVQSLTVVNNSTNVGGEVSATLSTKEAGDTLNPPQRVTGGALTLINDEAGTLGISWSTPEANSVIGYNIFYWMGDDAPNKPQYVAGKGELELSFTVPPGSYRVRVDVLSTYRGREVVEGNTKSIAVYGQPLPPQDLGVTFTRGVFTNIFNKFYAIGYPLTYTKASTPVEAGGPVEDIKYHYRYRVEGGDWIGYSEITNDAMISLQVEDLSDATVVKSGYGKKYQVEVIASNGSFISDVEALEFTYQSFPEPFIQNNNLVVETGNRSLTVTWPAVREANGATVTSYTAILNLDPYGLPVQSKTVQAPERKVVFEDLTNNQPYFITVIPNSAVTGNLLTALSVVTDYTIGEAIGEGSGAATILAAYTEKVASYTPQGAPEAVVNLAVTANPIQATVTWEEASFGSPATRYVLEYLIDAGVPVTNVDITGDATDAELSSLSWKRSASIDIIANASGRYSQTVDGLNVLSTINVFRVKGIHTDTSGKEWSGRYRYYALGSDIARAPSSVGELEFSEHSAFGSFKVTWTNPDDAGRNIIGVPAQLAGYRVSWGTTEELGNSFDITSSDTLSYTITGLTPGNQYYVKVQAKNNNTEENIYNAGSVKTTYTMRRPGTVVGSTIAYSDHTTDGFKVNWDAVTDAGYGPDGPLASVGYLLDYRANKGAWSSVIRSDYSATEETLAGLTPRALYQVRVIVTNEFSLPGTVGQGGETWFPSPPGPVEVLVVTDLDYDKVTHRGGFKVSWEAPLDTGRTLTGESVPITGYEVAYAEVVDGVRGEVTSVTLKTTNTELVFTGLKTNAKYDIRVQATNVYGIGMESQVSGWVPSLPGAVDGKSITFSHPTFRTIEIKWTAPHPGRAGGSSSENAPTLYKVEIAPEGGEYILVQDNSSANIITVTGLTKATTYRARITAKNTWGSAPASESTATGTTLDDIPTPPSAVRDLKAKSSIDGQVVLSWLPPNDPGTINGITPATISNYIVKYRTTTDNDFIVIHEGSEGVRLEKALTAASTTATVVGLSEDTDYTFLVAVVNSINAITPDAQSAQKNINTGIFVPQNLAKQLNSCTKSDGVGLTWDASPRATYYEIYERNENITGDTFREISGKIASNSYSRTGLTPSTSYTYKVRACKGTVCSGDSEPLTITTLSSKNLRALINSGRIPSDIRRYGQRAYEIFLRYNVGAVVVPKYVKASGTGNGSSYETAGNLKTVLDGITDASADKVYLVLLERGTYDINETINMKNHVAIVGGVNKCQEFSDTRTTLDAGGGIRLIHNKDLNHTALLYGIALIDGASTSVFRGMYPDTTDYFGLGGAVYNENSSPTFMWVTFTGNKARHGAAVYNKNSSPTFIGVTFSQNSANFSFGSGMYNLNSSPTLINVIFYLDDMYNDNNGKEGPLVVNSIFTSQITINNEGTSDTEKFRVYNSAVSTGDLKSDVVITSSFTKGKFKSVANGRVRISFTNNVSALSKLSQLNYYGGLVKTHSISTDSPWVNKGLFVRRKGSTYYFSEDKIWWYTNPKLSGSRVSTLPSDVEDLTATDATGHTRTDRPDIGTYEAR